MDGREDHRTLRSDIDAEQLQSGGSVAIVPGGIANMTPRTRMRWESAACSWGPEALTLAAILNKQMGLSLGHTRASLADEASGFIVRAVGQPPAIRRDRRSRLQSVLPQPHLRCAQPHPAACPIRFPQQFGWSMLNCRTRVDTSASGVSVKPSGNAPR